MSTGEKVKEPAVKVESVTDSPSVRLESNQPAGVGGTGPKAVPSCGACLRMPGATICLVNLSEAPPALCDREAAGGGPGGGPGSGLPGSHVDCRAGELLPDLLLVLDETPPKLMALADTALLDEGGIANSSPGWYTELPRVDEPSNSTWDLLPAEALSAAKYNTPPVEMEEV